MPSGMSGPNRVAVAFLAAVWLGYASSIASAQLMACRDMVVPRLTDGNVPTAPVLMSPGQPRYESVLSADGNLEFYLQSYPGVGPREKNAFTRDLQLVLAGPNATTWDKALGSSPSGCRLFSPRFRFTELPLDATVTTAPELASPKGQGVTSTCYFNIRFALSWQEFLTARGLGMCGFSRSVEKTEAMNQTATFEVFSGSVHWRWADYDNFTAPSPVRPVSTAWNPVTIKIQKVAAPVANNTPSQAVASNVNLTADPFRVTSFTYKKSSTGLVTATIAYNLSTHYPYYPFFASEASGAYRDGSQLLRGSDGSYAGLRLNLYPNATWINSYSDGRNGRDCNKPGDNCTMEGILTFSWRPMKGSVPDSCRLFSRSPQQFDLRLGCMGASADASVRCGSAMRDVVNDTTLGQFVIDGDVDFCASSRTDLGVTWERQFQVTASDATAGQAIVSSGSFSSPVVLQGIWLREFRVSRSDLKGDGYWSLWSERVDSSSDPDGSRTRMGVAAGFSRAYTDLMRNGRNWDVTTSFTPNIRVATRAPGSTYDDADRKEAMIVLPADKGGNFSLSVNVSLRLMYDLGTMMGPGAGGRRLVYREAQVVGSPSPVGDLSVSSGAVVVTVPESIKTNADGTLDSSSTSGPFTSQVIVMISVMGTVLLAGIAGAIWTGVRETRHLRDRDAAARAGGTDWHSASATATLRRI
ncbi:hypothetical protein DFJ74DRAFT_671528 [Hyaloraphidium curvatum]|nr:hypothetical protein DFJ74DRAFT_671528 [Hyaloraphidium curvatum]